MSPPHPREADARGSAETRRRRRAFLLAEFAVEDGTVCHLCGQFLDRDGKWHVDRWPVPGAAGGRYTRENIRPACANCNERHGLSIHPRARSS